MVNGDQVIVKFCGTCQGGVCNSLYILTTGLVRVLFVLVVSGRRTLERVMWTDGSSIDCERKYVLRLCRTAPHGVTDVTSEQHDLV